MTSRECVLCWCMFSNLGLAMYDFCSYIKHGVWRRSILGVNQKALKRKKKKDGLVKGILLDLCTAEEVPPISPWKLKILAQIHISDAYI